MSTNEKHVKLQAPPLWLLAAEFRACLELGAYFLTPPETNQLPQGDGHPVLVIPGFGGSEQSTGPLRAFLKKQGYATHSWRLGRNLGLTEDMEEQLLNRLLELQSRYDRKVSIVGWSLGGVFARELAKVQPDSVRFVISLGSPFNRNPKANHAWRLFQLLNNEIDEEHSEKHQKRSVPPPVPSTAIFSRYDGIVAWQCCLQAESHISENIEVSSSHLGFGYNPSVLAIIANRLAQLEESWQPYSEISNHHKDSPP